MPRKFYSLSDQTKKTLEKSVKAFAIHWDTSTEFVYQILREEKNDFYPPFREAYQAACEAGISTAEYDSDLEFIRTRNIASLPEIAEAFASKLRSDNRTLEAYLDAIKDGELTMEEMDELEELLLKEATAITTAVQTLKFKRQQAEKRGPIRAA